MKDPNYILRQVHLETAGLMQVLRDLEGHKCDPEDGLEQCTKLSQLIQYMRYHFRRKVKERDEWKKRNARVIPRSNAWSAEKRGRSRR